jgi:hypothetical protein
MYQAALDPRYHVREITLDEIKEVVESLAQAALREERWLRRGRNPRRAWLP